MVSLKWVNHSPFLSLPLHKRRDIADNSLEAGRVKVDHKKRNHFDGLAHQKREIGGKGLSVSFAEAKFLS